jgi:hypothetical protein
MNDVSCQLKHTYRRSDKQKMAMSGVSHIWIIGWALYIYICIWRKNKRKRYEYTLIRGEKKRDLVNKQINYAFVHK